MDRQTYRESGRDVSMNRYSPIRRRRPGQPRRGDLKDREYLRYKHMKDADERLFIFDIEITASGRDLVDGYDTDQAVLTK